MKFNKLILTAVLTASLATATAGGIPVFDGVAEGQKIAEMAQTVVQWTKEIAHWKKQYDHFKNHENAISGLKGLVSFDSDVKELVDSFEDLMKGNPDRILSRAEKYFGDLATHCDKFEDADKKKTCQQASLSEIIQQDFADRLNKKFEQELENIEVLEKKAANAKDAKSIAEVQAAIALQQNKIQLLAIQADNFNRLQQAQKEIAEKQRKEEYQARLKARKEERQKCGWFGCDSPYSTQKQNTATTADYDKILGL